MIIDIVIIVLIVLITVMGLLRNPVKCGIDLVLFIAFTFIFYNVLVGFQDQLIGLTGYSISQIGQMNIGGSVNNVNNSLNDLAKQLGITLGGINPTFANDDLYVQVGYSVVHSVFFMVSSIISLILAYAIGWGIYAIFRKKAKTIKKLPKMLISVGVSLVLALTFVTFTFSPVYMLSNNVTKVANYSENENLSNLVTFLNDTNNTAQSYSTELKDATEKLNKVNTEVNSYESTILEFDTDINNLKDRYDDFGNRINALSSKSLSTEDRYVVNEIKNKYDEYDSKVNDAFTSFNSSKEEYYKLKNEVNNYASQTGNVDNYLETLSNVTTNANQYYAKIKDIDGSYKQYLPSMFSFLGNFNFGYSNFDSTAFEVSNLNEFFDLLDKNLDSLINDDLVKLIEVGKTKINELIDTVNKYKDQLANFDTEYEKYKANIDKSISDGKEEINNINNEFDKYEEELKKLEEKYN